MPGHSRDTKNKKSSCVGDELSGAIVASVETSEEGKSSPKSLKDIILKQIAQNPFLSIQLIQNKSFDDSNIPEVLTKITPFIHILPEELKCELLTFLPIRDWSSLFNVSSEWRRLVVCGADTFLNEVARDKPNVISVYNFEGMLNSLLKKVENYSLLTRRRPKQVGELKKLEEEMSSLTQPLAKLFHCQQRIDEIQRAITREYGISTRVPFFVGPNNSKLYQILESSRKEIHTLTNSSWFKKVQFCVSLHPNHVVAKQFSDAFLELKNLQHDSKMVLLSF
ncbi:hypothetical protein [Legionella sp. WA2022007384]